MSKHFPSNAYNCVYTNMTAECMIWIHKIATAFANDHFEVEGVLSAIAGMAKH